MLVEQVEVFWNIPEGQRFLGRNRFTLPLCVSVNNKLLETFREEAPSSLDGGSQTSRRLVRQSGSAWVKFERSKSLWRCQHTSQISVHTADVIPGSGQDWNQFSRSDHALIVSWGGVSRSPIKNVHRFSLWKHESACKCSGMKCPLSLHTVAILAPPPPYVFLSSLACEPF